MQNVPAVSDYLMLTMPDVNFQLEKDDVKLYGRNIWASKTTLARWTQMKLNYKKIESE